MQTEKVIAYMVIAALIGFLIDTIMVLCERVNMAVKGMATGLPSPEKGLLNAVPF